MTTLLVIDDEPNICFSIQELFEPQGMQVLTAGTADEGIRLATLSPPDVVLLDIRLGLRSGLDVFRELRRIDPTCLAIFITGFGTTDLAIEAMKLGAYDYLVKPLDIGLLRKVVGQAAIIRRMMRTPARTEGQEPVEEDEDRLIGHGAAMQNVCKHIGRLAPQDVNVLILGESGTGKELVARAIYQHSQRSNAPFLAINCAAIPESLLESELFGHERGAFTGAEQRRIGKFEHCNGGTMFLDEVGDMAPHTQAKILRLLQEGRFERVGGNESITVDVRIVAATNQSLEQLIEQNRFRKDLYYRLRGAMIVLPPLREHPEDIAELAEHFMLRYNRGLGTSVRSIAPQSLSLLEHYHWPGNVRELQSVVREALIASAGPTLLPEFLPPELFRGVFEPGQSDGGNGQSFNSSWQALSQFVESAVGGQESDVYRRARDLFDRLVISSAMLQTGGNQNRAAAILGLSRVTLRAKLRQMNAQGQTLLATLG